MDGLLNIRLVFFAEYVFVVGYGLDYRDQYRNLPYVAALEPGEFEADA